MKRIDLSDKKIKRIKEIVLKIKMIAFDFDGVFTDNKVYVLQDGTEAVVCSRSDGIGLSAIKKYGIKTIIISTENNPVVTARSKKLKIACVQGCNDKLSELKIAAKEINCTLDEIAFVGNDVNDFECLSNVALPIVTKDAHPDVVPLGMYRTSKLGGHGAVREVCDIFCKILNLKI